MHMYNYRLFKFSWVVVNAFLAVINCYSQINVNESFKTGVAGTNIKLGGSTYLTSGVVDPENDGWLRLTNSVRNEKGYAYIDANLPSTLGVLIDFEYKTWRSGTDVNFVGGDGFSVFLFDATSTFTIGGYGGSLGYAPHTGEGAIRGLGGGYIGIGFDEYGNFSNPTEGRIGGPGQRCNSITLRGPTTNDPRTTNKYLASIQLQPDNRSDINSIDFNTLQDKRPSDSQFYRRVKIAITPTGSSSNPKYTITVRWRTSPNGEDVTLLTYTTETAPPPNLKLGFAASTGGDVNYHEIRNLSVQTPGGVSTFKECDKGTLNVGEDVTYTIHVRNSTPAPINNLILTDTLKDEKGNILNLASQNFTLKSITFDNNEDDSNTASGYTSGIPIISGFTNPFTSMLSLNANSSSFFTIVGSIKNDPALEGASFINSVKIDPSLTGITDQDFSDNYSFAVASVNITTPDLKISMFVDKPCADPVNGNIISILVSNISSVPINASDPKIQIIVTDTIPPGYTFIKPPDGTWAVRQNGNVLRFNRNGTLNPGATFEAIQIKVFPPATGNILPNYATVGFENNAIVEKHLENNRASVSITAIPSPPIVVSPVKYNLGEEPKPLSAEGTNLIWYTDLNSPGTTVAPVPVTTSLGSTTYYVSQKNGECESQLVPIVVIVETGNIVIVDTTVCESYLAPDDSVYTTSGIKIIHFKTEEGQDTTILVNLTVHYNSTKFLSVTACDSYLAPDGEIYTDSGRKTVIIPNAIGCDSIITIDLTIGKSTSDTINVKACDTYISPSGRIFHESGTIKDTIPNKAGCDSIITIHLMVKKTTTVEVSPTVCDTYISPSGKVYHNSGTIKDTIPNKAGCDSIITIHLEVNKTTRTEISPKVCDTYISPSGKIFHESALIIDTIPNKAGCDSIITIHLEVANSSKANLDTTVCDTYTSPSGKIYYDSGLIKDTIPNKAGCDSILTIHLQVNKSSATTLFVSTCDAYMAPDGQIYTDSGVKEAIIPNKAGCDSTIVIYLEIGKNTEKTIDITACDSYVAPDGVIYTDSGTKTAIIPNVFGCDSIITIHLIINQSSSVSQVIYMFEGDKYSINKHKYYKEGVYNDTLVAKNGCDSVITTEIKLIMIPNTITPNGDGKNDFFLPGYHVKIYNRNGILLFEGNNGWDGTHKGQPVGPDTYYFVLYFNSASDGVKTKEGYITVIR
ncbi:MAG TPA: gliding motility-associated C-terminal domain-containing protein [Paludibacteraceae bacterium]|nr:gliding motility-associated C-terminal domain-containing protein [Paludibacteraceae bacterium]